MTLAQLTQYANSYTDENFTTNQTLGYANTAISKINTELKSTLSMFNTNPSIDYTDLSDDWLMIVVLPHICWSIKMNDGSLNEAREYLMQFQIGLRSILKNKKHAIPEDKQGSGFQTKYTISRYTGMPKASTVLGADSNKPLGDEE